MCIACDKGVTKLRIRTDSHFAVSLLSNLNSNNHQHESLCMHFKLLCE
ncbi:hypothetical protein LINPERPRIM_LOCUS34474 [Linum perenne]